MKYWMPPEWEPHEACWIAWPSHPDLWGDVLVPVQAEIADLCRAIADAPDGQRVEKLKVLAPTAERVEQARRALEGLPAEFFEIGFGDVWLRDTAPIFLVNELGEQVPGCFLFNGWGGKYQLPFDFEVSKNIALAVGGGRMDFPLVLEGGSIEVDGEGTCLTTEQCLLNPNRNPALSRSEIEAALASSLGVQKVLWLKDGLINDHTDGHIDTLARFTAPGKVVCMRSQGPSDPNARVLKEIETALRSMVDAKGRRLEVTAISSPGLVQDDDGKILPASYVNFYLSNHTVVVPTYGVAADGEAVEAIGKLFPGRKAIGSSAAALLKGGGAFHCVTQQQPVKGRKHV